MAREREFLIVSGDRSNPTHSEPMPLWKARREIMRLCREREDAELHRFFMGADVGELVFGCVREFDDDTITGMVPVERPNIEQAGLLPGKTGHDALRPERTTPYHAPSAPTPTPAPARRARPQKPREDTTVKRIAEKAVADAKEAVEKPPEPTPEPEPTPGPRRIKGTLRRKT